MVHLVFVRLTLAYKSAVRLARISALESVCVYCSVYLRGVAHIWASSPCHGRTILLHMQHR